MTLYDLLGRVNETLPDRDELGAGYYTVMVDASSLPSGVYFYRLHATSSDDMTVSYQGQKK